MKIKSYAGGGIVYLPTTNKVEEAAQSGAAASSTTNSKVPGFASKIIDMIGEEGIDSDVNAFLRRVQRTLDLANDPTGENLSMKEIIKLSREASSVKTNYAMYQNAQKALDAEDAWGDVATDSRGNIYAYNNETKTVETISPSKYNTDNYTALTNKDLLEFRWSGSAYNTSMITDVTKSIGMKTISDYLIDVIKSFEKTEVTAYAGKQGKNIATGLKAIVDYTDTNGNSLGDLITAGPDGVYKITQKATVKDAHIDEAVNYLIKSLNNDMKHSLVAKAAVEGYSPEAYLVELLNVHTGRSISADYDDTATKAAGSAGSSAGELTGAVQHTLAESYADGQDLSGLPEMLEITPSGSTSSLVVYGQNAGPVVTDRSGQPGNPMGVTSIPQLFEDAYGVRSVTRNTIVFGDQLISTDDFGGLVYDGSDMYRVVLPCKKINGGRDIVPDFELQEKLDSVVKSATDQGADDTTITRLINEVCPGAKYNSETGGIQLPSDKKHVFLTFGAMAADNYIEFNGDSKYLTKSNSDADIYEETVKYGYANHAANAQERQAGTANDPGFLGLGWFKNTKNHLYQGNVFMPVTSNTSGSSMYNQEYIPKNAYTNVTGRAIENQRQAQVRERLSDLSNTNWGN